MITLADLTIAANNHSVREGLLRATLVCYKDSTGKVVYAKAAHVVPHPQTGEIVVVLSGEEQ